MSFVAESVVDHLLQLPKEDRVPVLKSILISAGPEIEQRVSQHERSLQEQGYEPKDALIKAFAEVLHEPDGGRIIGVMASAGAREAVRLGAAPTDDPAVVARVYADVLKEAEQIDPSVDDGLGAIVSAIITAATAVLTVVFTCISSAVRKARARRASLARRLTPLNEAEINEVITAVATVPSYTSYRLAEGAVLEMIGALREGRTAYLLEPTSGDNIGSIVNERRDLVAVFNTQRRAFNEQVRAIQTQQRLVYGGVAIVTAAVVTSTVVYVAGAKKK